MKTILSTLLAAFALNAFADTNKLSILDRAKAFAAKESGDLFGKETVVDFAAVYTVAKPNGFDRLLTTSSRGGDWGLSLAATHFIHRNLGFGFETGFRDWNNVHDTIIDHAASTFILRLPIDRFAISAEGRIGKDWDDGFGYFEFGPRIDARLNKRVGVFASGGMTYRDDESQNAHNSLRITVGGSVAF